LHINATVNEFNSFALEHVAPDQTAVVIIDSIITVSSGRSSLAPGQPIPFSESMTNQKLFDTVIPATVREAKLYYHALRTRRKACTVPFRHRLIVGARVILMHNVDVDLGLINGARGRVTPFILDGSNIATIIVTFDHRPNTPIAISRCLVNKYNAFNSMLLRVFQFPLRLGWAVTAHKLHGQTLDRVTINIAEGAFAHGSFYVALSRVRRLEDIMLFGLAQSPSDGICFRVNEFIRSTEADLRDTAINLEPIEELE
jgi:hypothetical protein